MRQNATEKQEVVEELIAYSPYMRRGPHTERRFQQEMRPKRQGSELNDCISIPALPNAKPAPYAAMLGILRHCRIDCAKGYQYSSWK